MIHPTHPNAAIGRTMRLGLRVTGLTLTDHSESWTFATDHEGHEWYTDRLDVPELAPNVYWHHAPALCNECMKPRRPFIRPMGVPK